MMEIVNLTGQKEPKGSLDLISRDMVEGKNGKWTLHPERCNITTQIVIFISLVMYKENTEIIDIRHNEET